MENTNTQVETHVEEKGFFGKAKDWFAENWAYVAGAVVVTGAAYGAYRYFGGESEEAEAPAPQLENGVDRAAL